MLFRVLAVQSGMSGYDVPCAGGFSGDADVVASGGGGKVGNRTVAGLRDVAGLREVHLPAGRLCIDPLQEEVREAEPRGSLVVRLCRVASCREDRGSDTVLRCSPHDDGHIFCCRVVVIVIQSGAVCEVRRGGYTELLCLLIHEGHKLLLGAGDAAHEGEGGIRTTREDEAIEEIQHRHLLARLEATV